MTYGKPVAGVCLATATFLCVSGAPVLPGNAPAANGTLVSTSTPGQSGIRVTEGGQVTVSGSGYIAHASVTLGVYSSPITLGHIVATSSGSFIDTVRLPGGLTGSHTLIALGDGPAHSARALELGLNIQPGSGLAVTGFRTTAWLLAAVLLILTGFALMRGAAMQRRNIYRPAHALSSHNNRVARRRPQLYPR